MEFGAGHSPEPISRLGDGLLLKVIQKFFAFKAMLSPTPSGRVPVWPGKEAWRHGGQTLKKDPPTPLRSRHQTSKTEGGKNKFPFDTALILKYIQN